MSSYLLGHRALLSATKSPRTVDLQQELAKACGDGNTVNIHIGNLISSGKELEIADHIQSASKALADAVDLFIIDARDLEPCGSDPIWEVPLSEWSLQLDANRVTQQRTLSQAKVLLQHLLTLSNSVKKPGPFSLVIVGYRDSFDSSLDPVVSKLQRDVSWLDRGASVNFLDLASSVSEPTEQSLAAAIGILVSAKPKNSIVTINSVWSLRTSRPSSSDNANSLAVSELSLSPTIHPKRPTVKIALSFDYDALAAFLGTGDHCDNNLADYSTGVFSGRVGGLRLLRMLKKYQIADKVTWFIPAHTMETFEPTVRQIIESGAEIGLHGYAHEGAYQMTPEQEHDVLVKSMAVSQRLTGKKVLGYRAPMYQLRETTIVLLKEFGFLYDSSLSHHDSQPYFTPSDPPIERIDFSKPAHSWLKPTPLSPMHEYKDYPLVEIPIGWNNEDMMALQYFPHSVNTNGNVDARVVEQRWKDIFLWLWENGQAESDDGTFIFPLLMHPDTSGMAHIMAMADRFVGWLRSWGDSVQFECYENIARGYLRKRGIEK
ncbi:hypothetical protein SCUCBS95973_009100 [Sporothrix curviconia]|uniref:NodB homology domain-containing protein n=1 Tax=Sporothrix curviconia TaxID=1260050 RepID=A0ABP0CTL4_9PEZI